jgi:hypothetical protein
MLRIAAALALVLGVCGLVGYFHLVGKSPFNTAESRHLRAMKDRLAAPAAPAPITFAEFAALPAHRPLAEYAAIERRGVTAEGWVQHVVRAADGDLHIELAPAPRDPAWGAPAHSDTVYITAEITPGVRARHPAWSYAALIRAFRPIRGSGVSLTEGHVDSWDLGPRRVRLGGWLLYDFPNDRGRDRGPEAREHAALQLGAWEIHPVTSIEVWDEQRSAWGEVTP